MSKYKKANDKNLATNYRPGTRWITALSQALSITEQSAIFDKPESKCLKVPQNEKRQKQPYLFQLARASVGSRGW